MSDEDDTYHDDLLAAAEHETQWFNERTADDRQHVRRTEALAGHRPSVVELIDFEAEFVGRPARRQAAILTRYPCRSAIVRHEQRLRWIFTTPELLEQALAHNAILTRQLIATRTTRTTRRASRTFATH